ncbi:MAG: hypothetical protein KAH56_04525 [Candidatus Krumholzibacteria bacterium]|nr:hypothetical protein [Candidatus Krumholzibacteria bacterium]
MKNLLSILSGRLMSLVFPAAVIVSFLAPTNALAVKEISLGGGGTGGTEGDPLDTNDYGSSGGDGGDDVHDQTGTAPTGFPFVFEFNRIQVLLVPQYVGGTLTFKIMFIDSSELSPVDLSMEGSNAP